MQCLDCLKSKQPLHIGFFCSAECLQAAWAGHKKLHNPVPSIKWTDLEEDEDGQEVSDQDLDSDDEMTLHRKPKRNTGTTLSEVCCKFPPPISNLWAEVSQFRTYVPAPEDVGRALRVECAPILRELSDSDMVQNMGGLDRVVVDSKAREIRMARNGSQKFIVGKWRRLQTNAVLAAPGVPPPRQRVFKVRQENNVGKSFLFSPFFVLCSLFSTKLCFHFFFGLSYLYERS